MDNATASSATASDQQREELETQEQAVNNIVESDDQENKKDHAVSDLSVTSSTEKNVLTPETTPTEDTRKGRCSKPFVTRSGRTVKRKILMDV
ncbi:hypothetical protein OESDEN_11523 [Oesophagostomum dentatum]|uniref:Uncharacterized protein n=1 Tax=Oesophagostomum dentatum TaxID=61180 RepID=A0A0B1SYX0_OESDE|nr:hypothetical protein OESDEN_11523 [Oesophagostomum dentatum]